MQKLKARRRGRPRSDWERIRKLAQSGRLSGAEIAERVGCTRRTVVSVLNRRKA